jgi:hypothetical protein
MESGVGDTVQDMPQAGDNFVRVGPWNILEGSAWHDWRRAALRAQIRCSKAAGDAIAVRRLIREIERLEAAGPGPVSEVWPKRLP